MSYVRYLPFPLIVLGIAGLTGALSLPARSTAPVFPPGRAPDAAVLRLLDQALERFAPERVDWLETSVRESVRLPEFTFQAEGKHLQAPGNRYRTELRTRQGDTTGVWLAVSDGVHSWQKCRVGKGPWRDFLYGPAGDTLAGPASAAILPLLRDLRERFDWIRREAGNERNQVRLMGVWKPELLAVLAPAGQPWPEGLPSLCRLDLDARSLWLHQVEWWGPSHEGAAATLLAVLQFGNPVLHQPLPAAECDRLFTFDTAH